MQNFSENARVTTNKNGLGWNLTAANTLKPGDVILEEQPLFIAPHWENERMKCVNCHQDSFVMCKKCQFFPLCLNCTTHNEFDCEFMMKAVKTSGTDSHSTSNSIGISKDLLVKNYAIYAVLKLLLLIENEKTRNCCDSIFPLIVELKDEFRNSESWREHEEHVVKPLLESGLLLYFSAVIKIRGAQIDGEFLHELCFLIDSHAFEVTKKNSDDSLKAIYTIGTRIPHNCVPNTAISFDESFKMKIYAAVPIQKGQTIYNCYVNPLMGTSQRQLQLRLSRQITCRCERCLDPTEMDTNLSTLKCQKCTLGLLTCIKPPDGNNWKCDECDYHMETDQVNNLLAEIAEEMALANNDLESYERLLINYESRFHPHHFLMIDIKQNIASILGLLLSNPYSNSERKYLERKLEISNEVLPLIRAVQPGISRLYTIALYDFVVTSLELTEIRYSKKEIHRTVYIQTLQQANSNMHEVVNMLSFEPKNSTEGHLAQRIILEKKRIEHNIQNVVEEMN